MSTHGSITLIDGRILSYAEYGPRSGLPVFYFHGFPGSRLDWRLIVEDDTVLDELGVRVIAPDRPGYGESSFQRNRILLDWPDDVAELAEALEISNFAVLGISGGGPYAAACAYKLPRRVGKVGMVSSMGPADAPGATDGVSWMLPGMPSLVRRSILRLTALGLRKDPDKFLQRSKDSMAAVDAAFLEDPAKAASFAAALAEAFRHGIRGANQEARLYTRPWGFGLGDVESEVYLWHGEQDLNVPLSVGRYLGESIAQARTTFSPTDGHLSLLRSYSREILATLTETGHGEQ